MKTIKTQIHFSSQITDRNRHKRVSSRITQPSNDNIISFCCQFFSSSPAIQTNRKIHFSRDIFSLSNPIETFNWNSSAVTSLERSIDQFPRSFPHISNLICQNILAICVCLMVLSSPIQFPVYRQSHARNHLYIKKVNVLQLKCLSESSKFVSERTFPSLDVSKLEHRT